MIEDLDYNKIIEELQGDNYGDYPAELVRNTLAEGAPSGYDKTGELLNDLSTAFQSIEADETKDKAEESLEKYFSNFEYLKKETYATSKEILDYLDQETFDDHQPEALAGASTYVSTVFTNQKITKEEVKQAGELGDGIFRSAYEDIRSQVTQVGLLPVSDFP